ncbi:MAG: L-2-hydroxyglutarate oxidase [Actinobacteria bacterium]|nr:L-2-hydroxyglutarate oxidase [Actinomycetota bacterium]
MAAPRGASRPRGASQRTASRLRPLPAPSPASQPPAECDLVVVGGGIVGQAVARELILRRPGARVAVLEAEAGIGAHQTGRSSGVVHSGIYYAPGSLKARLCVEGARELYAYCEEKGVPYRMSGKLIVAVEEGELGRLEELERRGIANSVPGLRRLRADEIAAVEPEARGVAALHSPHTGVVDFVAAARAYGADVAAAGGTLHTDTRVLRARPRGGRLAIEHSRGTTLAAQAVFCAGLWSDRLAVACGAPADPRIIPFRGAYLKLREPAAALVRANVYPVPDPDLPFLGAHLTRNLAGEVLIGPSALMAPARDAYELRRARRRDLGETLRWPGTWKVMRRHWRAGVVELRNALHPSSFVAEAARMVPALAGAHTAPGPAGIRAQAVGRDGTLVDDFVVHRTEHAIHVRNAPSPAATSSLALARLIADRLDESG